MLSPANDMPFQKAARVYFTGILVDSKALLGSFVIAIAADMQRRQ